MTCSSQVPELDKVRPRCLWEEVFLIFVPFIKRGGWNTGLRLREINIASIFKGLKKPSQAEAKKIIIDSVIKELKVTSQLEAQQAYH